MDSISHGRTSVRLWTRSGKVIDSSKRTSVVSSGSRENLEVSSITKHDFWIREDDGSEVPIQTVGVDIPLRVGQRISVVAAAPDGEENGHAVALANHSSKQWYQTLSEEQVRSLFRVTTHPAVAWVVVALSILVFGANATAPDAETTITGRLAIGQLPTAVAYLVYNLRKYFKSGERLYHCFGEVAENIVREGYDAAATGKAKPVKAGLASSSMLVLSKKALFGAMLLAVPVSFLATLSDVGNISDFHARTVALPLAYFLLFFPLIWAGLSVVGGVRRWILPSRPVKAKTKGYAGSSSGSRSPEQNWTWRPVTICTVAGLLTVPLITIIIEVDPVQMLAPGEWQEALMAVGAFTAAGGVVGLIISGGIWTWRFLRRS